MYCDGNIGLYFCQYIFVFFLLFIIPFYYIENLIAKREEARKNKPKVEKPKEYQYVEGLLRKKYRTRIKVDDKSITIKYTDTQDLNRLLELMGVIEES